MQRCESPRHPFNIFTSHFPVPPGTIVYDNGSKLRAYCLNREPALYIKERNFYQPAEIEMDTEEAEAT